MEASNHPLRIACIGECMIELSEVAIAARSAQVSVAGDTFNTAIYLARLLPRRVATVSYLTAVGTDQLSEQMLAVMRAEGIETDRIVRRDDRLPGIYAIELDPAGERSFRYWRSQSAARLMFQPGGVPLDDLDGFDVLYLSGISLAILPAQDRAKLLEKLQQLKAAGRQIIFDSNYRPRLWESRTEAFTVMQAAWLATTLGLPSLDDEAALSGQSAAQVVLSRLSDCGVGEIALKRGPEGPVVWAQGTVVEAQFPAAAAVLDTTAAGDSFNAAYLAARLTGAQPATAAQRGHALATHVIGQSGAIVDITRFQPANVP